VVIILKYIKISRACCLDGDLISVSLKLRRTKGRTLRSPLAGGSIFLTTDPNGWVIVDVTGPQLPKRDAYVSIVIDAGGGGLGPKNLSSRSVAAQVSVPTLKRIEVISAQLLCQNQSGQ
jgi:hypothetical protein